MRGHEEPNGGDDPHEAGSESRAGDQADVGRQEIRQMWEAFVERNPEALNVAHTYGTREARFHGEVFHGEVLERWTQGLEEHLEAQGEQDGIRLREGMEFVSPLHADL